ncbi:MAG TPA: 2-C-methyl-D-erythritol 4-phosphate cytidylyltransferase [Dermatophilaceae bacterium]|nr:2-C-methyl-D-erythritol 4-phosphate cytidylyltransferase [Dermatophilaceae bacterium]
MTTPTATQRGRVGVVVVAAGAGTRLGADVPKAFVTVAGRPLLWYAAHAAVQAAQVGCVVAVVPASHVEDAQDLLEPLIRSSGVAVQVVPGGAERGDSVLAGVRWLPAECEVVLVHDAARAFAPPDLFDRVAGAVSEATPAVVPGLPVVDTVKSVDAEGLVVQTLERATLRAVQTPQGFRREVLLAAHAAYGSLATDDAGLVERLGRPVLVVAGDPLAVKVTTPADLATAERIAAGEATGVSGA